MSSHQTKTKDEKEQNIQAEVNNEEQSLKSPQAPQIKDNHQRSQKKDFQLEKQPEQQQKELRDLNDQKKTQEEEEKNIEKEKQKEHQPIKNIKDQNSQNKNDMTEQKIQVIELKQDQNPKINLQERGNLILTQQDYISKELFNPSKLNFNILQDQKKKQIIFNNKINQFKLSSEQFGQNILLKSLQQLNIFSQNKNIHLIRVVDLLYKKFILIPQKLKDNEQKLSQNAIYKPDPVYGQTYYYFPQLKKINKADVINKLKRDLPGKMYSQNNTNSPENDSSTGINDEIQIIQTSNHSNGGRKIKNQNFQQNKRQIQNNGFDPRFQMQQRVPMQGMPGIVGMPGMQGMNHNININRNMNHPGNNVNAFQPLPYQPIQPVHQTPVKSVFQDLNEQKNQRFQQQRTIAKIFVKDGYGLNVVRNYLGPDIDGGVYNRAVTSIIRQSYKKLQQYLSQKCMIKIHILTSSEFSLIKTPLVHCRNILRGQDLKTFFKFIAMTYNFGKLKPQELPTVDQALNLYNAISRGLNDRKNAKESVPKNLIGKELSRR